MARNNKALNYLSRVSKNFQAVELQIEKISMLRSRAESVSHALCNDNSKAKSSIQDNNAEIVARIVDLENELAESIQDNLNEYEKIKHQIDSMQDFKYRTLLEYKFLCNKTYQEIADILNYSIRNIYKLMNEALAKFESMYLSQETA